MEENRILKHFNSRVLPFGDASIGFQRVKEYIYLLKRPDSVEKT